MVERCKLVGRKLHKHILVQLATRMKRKVIAVFEDYKFTMNGFQTKSNLGIIPLGSYDILLGIDWIELHHAILDYHRKFMTFLDEEENSIQIKGIPRLISVREI